jgi:hypothetical protein
VWLSFSWQRFSPPVLVTKILSDVTRTQGLADPTSGLQSCSDVTHDNGFGGLLEVSLMLVSPLGDTSLSQALHWGEG